MIAVITFLEIKAKVKEAHTTTLTSLIVSLIIGLFGGTFLGKYFEKIRFSYPGLLVILPGMMGLRGNVFGSMASRFSTMLYLGDLEPSLREKKVLKNVVLGIALSLIPVSLLWSIGILGGIRENAFDILLIVISSTILVSLILGYFTAFVTIFTFRRGSDPDNVAAPLVASMGDLLTIPSLIAFILLLEQAKTGFWMMNAFLVTVFVALALIGKVKKKEFLSLKSLFTTVILLAILSVISGSLLERYSPLIQKLSIAYPALLSSFGNYGSIIAAKTSTRLHLGEIEDYFSGEMFLEILALFTTAPIIGILINFLAFIIAKCLLGIHGEHMELLILTYPLMALFIMLYAYTVSYVLFQKNIDPDHVAIPFISNNSDIFGTIYTVLIAKLMVG